MERLGNYHGSYLTLEDLFAIGFSVFFGFVLFAIGN